MCYPKSVIVLFAAVGILLILGIARIEIDTVYSEYYPPDSPVRRSIILMDEHFLGTGNMEILLETETKGVFRDPEVLAQFFQCYTIIGQAAHPNDLGFTLTKVFQRFFQP